MKAVIYPCIGVVCSLFPVPVPSRRNGNGARAVGRRPVAAGRIGDFRYFI